MSNLKPVFRSSTRGYTQWEDWNRALSKWKDFLQKTEGLVISSREYIGKPKDHLQEWFAYLPCEDRAKQMWSQHILFLCQVTQQYNLPSTHLEETFRLLMGCLSSLETTAHPRSWWHTHPFHPVHDQKPSDPQLLPKNSSPSRPFVYEVWYTDRQGLAIERFKPSERMSLQQQFVHTCLFAALVHAHFLAPWETEVTTLGPLHALHAHLERRFGMYPEDPLPLFAPAYVAAHTSQVRYETYAAEAFQRLEVYKQWFASQPDAQERLVRVVWDCSQSEDWKFGEWHPTDAVRGAFVRLLLHAPSLLSLRNRVPSFFRSPKLADLGHYIVELLETKQSYDRSVYNYKPSSSSSSSSSSSQSNLLNRPFLIQETYSAEESVRIESDLFSREYLLSEWKKAQPVQGTNEQIRRAFLSFVYVRRHALSFFLQTAWWWTQFPMAWNVFWICLLQEQIVLPPERSTRRTLYPVTRRVETCHRWGQSLHSCLTEIRPVTWCNTVCLRTETLLRWTILYINKALSAQSWTTHVLQPLHTQVMETSPRFERVWNELISRTFDTSDVHRARTTPHTRPAPARESISSIVAGDHDEKESSSSSSGIGDGGLGNEARPKSPETTKKDKGRIRKSKIVPITSPSLSLSSSSVVPYGNHDEKQSSSPARSVAPRLAFSSRLPVSSNYQPFSEHEDEQEVLAAATGKGWNQASSPVSLVDKRRPAASPSRIAFAEMHKVDKIYSGDMDEWSPDEQMYLDQLQDLWKELEHPANASVQNFEQTWNQKIWIAGRKSVIRQLFHPQVATQRIYLDFLEGWIRVWNVVESHYRLSYQWWFDGSLERQMLETAKTWFPDHVQKEKENPKAKDVLELSSYARFPRITPSWMEVLMQHCARRCSWFSKGMCFPNAFLFKYAFEEDASWFVSNASSSSSSTYTVHGIHGMLQLAKSLPSPREEEEEEDTSEEEEEEKDIHSARESESTTTEEEEEEEKEKEEKEEFASQTEEKTVSASFAHVPKQFRAAPVFAVWPYQSAMVHNPQEMPLVSSWNWNALESQLLVWSSSFPTSYLASHAYDASSNVRSTSSSSSKEKRKERSPVSIHAFPSYGTEDPTVSSMNPLLLLMQLMYKSPSDVLRPSSSSSSSSILDTVSATWIPTQMRDVRPPPPVVKRSGLSSLDVQREAWTSGLAPSHPLTDSIQLTFAAQERGYKYSESKSKKKIPTRKQVVVVAPGST